MVTRKAVTGTIMVTSRDLSLRTTVVCADLKIISPLTAAQTFRTIWEKSFLSSPVKIPALTALVPSTPVSIIVLPTVPSVSLAPFTAPSDNYCRNL